MQHLIVFLLVSRAAVAGAAAEDLAAENAQLKKEIERLKENCGCESLSPLGTIKRGLGITADVANHILDQTDVDEKLVHHASKHYETAKALTSETVKKVASIDYAGKVQDLASHPFYVDNISPHVEKASKAARPYMDQYVNPALEKAGQHLEPALKTAKEAATKAHKSIREEVMPGISRAGSKALEHVSDTPKHVDKAHSFMHRVISPLYDVVHRVSPEHAKELPRHPVDRLLLIIVIVFVLYHTSWIIVRLFSVGMTLAKFSMKTAGWLFYLFVQLPFKIASGVIGYSLWIGTLFGCCGLCCRSKKNKQNGSAEPAPTKKAAEYVTEAEIKELLEKAKKHGKLKVCAEQLSEGAKANKVMPATDKMPAKLKGKKVNKDLLKKVLSNYKTEVDLKKLGL